MNLNQITYALKISEVRNFTEAARQLYVSQPTLSQQIKELENELNVTLFLRGRHKTVTLTPAGHEFIRYAQRIQDNLNSMNVSLGRYCSLERGVIRIGLLWTFGYAGIDRLLDAFTKTYARISMNVMVNGSTVLIDKVQNGDLDVAFVTENIQHVFDANLDSVPLCSSEIGVICHRDLPLSRMPYIMADDLINQRIMMVSHLSNIYPPIHASFQKACIKPEIIGESSQADVISQIAKSKLGIGFLSRQAYTSLSNESLAWVPYRPSINRNIYLVAHHNTCTNTSVRAFTKSVMDNLSLLVD